VAGDTGNCYRFVACVSRSCGCATTDPTRFQGPDPPGQIRMICARAAV
jgi:hypothetical protein